MSGNKGGFLTGKLSRYLLTLPIIFLASMQLHAGIAIDGKHFVDETGARIIFRGYNLQTKVPPFQTVKDINDLEPLKRVGSNLMRFNFIWEAAEPMKAVYDESYFEYYDRVINWAWESGMYVIIDFHNNAYSRYAADGCGSGFPQWAISPENPVHQPKAQGECTFSLAMMEAMLTPENYRNWQHFMNNTYGVRDRFFELTRKLAEKYKDHPAVIGFDLNEPMVFKPFLVYDSELVNHFYVTWHNFIQTVDTGYITFLGDSPFQFININKPPELTIPDTGLVSFDAHFYEVGSHTFGTPLLDTRPNLDAIVATRDLYNIPVLIGEYGVNLKNGEKRVFQYQMDSVMSRIDQELLSSTRWAYTPHWTPETKDNFHDEDFSCFNEQKEVRVSCAPRANLQRLSGELVTIDIQHRGEAIDFNPLLPFLSNSNQYEKTSIDLAWMHEPSQGETVIYASESVIFEGRDVHINTWSNDIFCDFDAERQYIHCQSDTAGYKRVTISEADAVNDGGLALGGAIDRLFIGLLMLLYFLRSKRSAKKQLLDSNIKFTASGFEAINSTKLDMLCLALASMLLVACNGDVAVPGSVPQEDSGYEYVIYESEIPEGRRLAYTEPREPCALYNQYRNPYFGDTHIHTARSLDASIQDTRLTPYQAYQFAKGKSMGIQPWIDGNMASRTLQIGRPLDFAMVSDHASFFGEMEICKNPGIDPLGYYGLTCTAFRANPGLNFIPWNLKYFAAFEPTDGNIDRFNFCGPDGEDCRMAAIPVWREQQDAANAAYDKTADCSFTSFIGYEHSGSPQAENIHRNVMFKNRNVPSEPLAYVDYSKPENLWKGLDVECTDAINCEVLTIPHNSNVSGGRMFRRHKDATKQQDFDLDYVTMRAKYEPLIEVYQHKGDSECSRSADEFCQFEKFPYDSLTGDRFDGLLTQEPSEDSFIRWALKEGLNQKNTWGINPFKYGMIGSTDTHLGTPGAVSETNAPGHGGAGGGDALNGLTDSIAFSGGGLAVVWAEENSREYLFDAMQRKETYATSGPRMLVRMFGSWSLPQSMCDTVTYDITGSALIHGSFVQTGYNQGVPMGSDLTARPDTATAPYFAIAALKDPGYDTHNPDSDLYEAGYPLQRIQVIKGWVDAAGNHKEKVYDVAGGDNGATVSLDTCQTSGEGAEQLCAIWQDPDFDPSLDAFYYARVIENPSCRWSWMQCQDYMQGSSFSSFEEACSERGLLPDGYQRCCLHNHLSDLYPSIWEESEMGTYPATVQERAWTSPIWYNAQL